MTNLDRRAYKIIGEYRVFRQEHAPYKNADWRFGLDYLIQETGQEFGIRPRWWVWLPPFVVGKAGFWSNCAEPPFWRSVKRLEAAEPWLELVGR